MSSLTCPKGHPLIEQNAGRGRTRMACPQCARETRWKSHMERMDWSRPSEHLLAMAMAGRAEIAAADAAAMQKEGRPCEAAPERELVD